MDSIRMRGDGMFDPPADMCSYDILIFPILHISANDRRGSDHWTVLVLEKSEGDYKFYNPLIARSNINDSYIQDANLLKDAVDKTGRYHKLDLPYDEKVVLMNNVPQQKSDSVNCGVVVCYIVRQYFENKIITKAQGVKDIPNMRKEIVETLLE
ncbi:hypothetical protein ACP275_03G028200 [Erythranthe tilingii]